MRMQNRSLSELEVGESGRVVAVDGDRQVKRRLLEMGLLPGTRVDVVRVAPLGDPVELRLRGYALSIRRVEASRIQITPDGASDEVP
jgi:Fe2+ transport system protein FeoA